MTSSICHTLQAVFWVEAMTFDKYVLNNYLRGFGINVADSILLRRGEAYDEEEIAKRIGMPCFVKPAADGSSFGVSKVKNADQRSSPPCGFHGEQ